jgi:DNA-directed RNA polymerase specialized sigma24 family protein
VAKEMTKAASLQKRETNPYAIREDFHAIFNESLDELYQLSFLLTRDHGTAERCLVGGLEDCVTSNRIFRDWAHSWAKRVIVQNAIRELKPRPNVSTFLSSGAIVPDIDSPDGHVAMSAVLGLGDFERFVFVISVLEHYSEHECALLLGCSSKEIREARARALKELTDLSRRDLLLDELFQQETK